MLARSIIVNLEALLVGEETHVRHALFDLQLAGALTHGPELGSTQRRILESGTEIEFYVRLHHNNQ